MQPAWPRFGCIAWTESPSKVTRPLPQFIIGGRSYISLRRMASSSVALIRSTTMSHQPPNISSNLFFLPAVNVWHVGCTYQKHCPHFRHNLRRESVNFTNKAWKLSCKHSPFSGSVPPASSLWKAYHCTLLAPTSEKPKYCLRPSNNRNLKQREKKRIGMHYYIPNKSSKSLKIALIIPCNIPNCVNIRRHKVCNSSVACITWISGFRMPE